MEVSDAKRLRVQEDENRRLKQLVADLSLDKEALSTVVGVANHAAWLQRHYRTHSSALSGRGAGCAAAETKTMERNRSGEFDDPQAESGMGAGFRF